MREWRRGSALGRWLDERPRRRMLLAIGIACAAYLTVSVITLTVNGDDSVPWLPANANEYKGEFLLAVAALYVAVFAVPYVRGRMSRRAARGASKRTWRLLPRPGNSYALGVTWSLTGWRLWTFGLLLYAPCIPWLWLNFTKKQGEPIWGDLDFWNEASLVDMWITAQCCFFMIYAFILKGREVRRGKERIKVADEYLAIREERLYAEVDATFEKFLQQQQEWKAKKMAELYEQILNQQAQGILPCPNCGEHRKSA